jgi:hypothetical protein
LDDFKKPHLFAHFTRTPHTPKQYRRYTNTIPTSVYHHTTDTLMSVETSWVKQTDQKESAMTNPNQSPRTAGVIFVVVSAIVFSSAGIFTKGVSADAWIVIFWRGIAATTFTLIYMTWRGGFWSEV